MDQSGEELKMQTTLRMLMVIITAEFVICGYLVVKQVGQQVPVIPSINFDDPLLAADLNALAETARQGDSQEWQVLGDGLLGQGFYGEAELAFRQALDMDPQNAMAQFKLAFCLDRTGRVAESTSEYLRAAKIAKPSEALIGSRKNCLYQVGRNALRQEQSEVAEKLFLEGAGFLPAAYQYSKLLVRSNRAAEAMPTIEHGLEVYPNSLKFTEVRMNAFKQMDRQFEAEQEARMLERSESVMPTDFSLIFILPLNAMIGFQHEEEISEQLWTDQSLDLIAKKMNELLLLLEPTSHQKKYALRKSLIKVEYERQNADRMLELIDQAHTDGDFDAELLQREGEAYALKGDWERAASMWLRVVKMSPNAAVHEKLAQYYEASKDTPKRDEHLGYAALLNAKENYLKNQLEEAKEAATKAQKLLPEIATVWFYSAEIERALRNPDRARSNYALCVKLDPSHGRAIRGLQSLAEN
ncbi:tetratricopeptide repeat protein [Rubinisphaera italica]|uniref:Tetratricopeptide repeat protein n=1 Tax=Rubinisphaera italica TaxID=2527969 RepID=A0A5C5XAH5_9PLAN|nr:tetratricopeptide repeat protein [Rubinisphaera italica]TWT59980.1 Tetratricopeptide repeat protein [Rubinisphaera italica]